MDTKYLIKYISRYYFVTGNFQIQNSAQAENMETLAFCDKYNEQFRQLLTAFGIHPTDFVRTTEERHRVAVDYFWVRSFLATH